MLRDLGVHNAKEPAHADYETEHTVTKILKKASLHQWINTK